jgi:hypothetical protein
VTFASGVLALRREMALVPERPAKVLATVAENVCYGPRLHDRDRVRRPSRGNCGPLKESEQHDGNPWGLHGFAILDFDEQALNVRFVDQNGRTNYEQQPFSKS